MGAAYLRWAALMAIITLIWLGKTGAPGLVSETRATPARDGPRWRGHARAKGRWLRWPLMLVILILWATATVAPRRAPTPRTRDRALSRPPAENRNRRGVTGRPAGPSRRARREASKNADKRVGRRAPGQHRRRSNGRAALSGRQLRERRARLAEQQAARRKERTGFKDPMEDQITILSMNVAGIERDDYNRTGRKIGKTKRNMVANVESYMWAGGSPPDVIQMSETKLEHVNSTLARRFKSYAMHGANAGTQGMRAASGGVWMGHRTGQTYTGRALELGVAKPKEFRSLVFTELTDPGWERPVVVGTLYGEWGGYAGASKNKDPGKLAGLRQEMLTLLDSSLAEVHSRYEGNAHVVLCGDFNWHAKDSQTSAAALPRSSPDSSGNKDEVWAACLLATLGKHGLVILNNTKLSENHLGDTAAGFTRVGQAGQANTVIDYVCVSARVAEGCAGVVCQHWTDDFVVDGRGPLAGSDHCPQWLTLNITRRKARAKTPVRWVEYFKWDLAGMFTKEHWDDTYGAAGETRCEDTAEDYRRQHRNWSFRLCAIRQTQAPLVRSAAEQWVLARTDLRRAREERDRLEETERFHPTSPASLCRDHPPRPPSRCAPRRRSFASESSCGH